MKLLFMPVLFSIVQIANAHTGHGLDAIATHHVLETGIGGLILLAITAGKLYRRK